MKTKVLFIVICCLFFSLVLVHWGVTNAATSLEITGTAYGDANQDAYAQSGFPNSAAGGTRNMYLGYDTLYNKYLTRMYIQYNLPSLPSGAQIDSAYLEVYQYVIECSSNYGVTAYEVTSDWNELSLTWNNQPSKGASVGSTSITCNNGWKSIDITNMVRNWYQGTPNRGVTIWANNENAPGGIYWAKECSPSQCPGQEHPRLMVNYSIPVPPTPTYTPPPPSPTPTPPPPVCSVPYFSQRDPQWRNHPLRTRNGACSVSCNTIGACGCTLTSGAMIFKHFEASLTPASLSDCMGTSACPFYWGVGASCSQGQAQFVAKYVFSWNRLQTELNQNHRPVILGMHRYVNGVLNTHWIVVISGSGTNPANYTIHDPWPINGANMRLNSYSGWYFDWISVYAGDTACQHLVGEAIQNKANNAIPVFTTNETTDTQRILKTTEATSLPVSGAVAGNVELYRMTAVTMTLQIDADPTATEMLIWTDNMNEAVWQPVAEFVYLPVGETIYARFRDAANNISDLASDTRYPPSSPPLEAHKVYLPAVLRP